MKAIHLHDDFVCFSVPGTDWLRKAQRDKWSTPQESPSAKVISDPCGHRSETSAQRDKFSTRQVLNETKHQRFYFILKT